MKNKTLKFIRIFLLVLIIIGIILICTQKIWVPKLVNYILSKEVTVQIIPQSNSTTQPVVTLQDGRQCYTYSHDATKDAPYAVSEFIDMNIKGSVVTGTKHGTQGGPDMTNGYTGTIDGILDHNAITDIFSYTIEGSHNKEQEMYRASQTGIEKLRYPLIEQKGILVPDTTKPFTVLSYARVGCVPSN